MTSTPTTGPKDEFQNKLESFKKKEKDKQDKYEIIFERICPIHIMIQSNIPDKAPFLLKSTSFASERPETASRAPKYSEYPFFTNEYEYPLTKMETLKQHEIIDFFFNEAMFVELLRKYLKRSESLMIDTKDKLEENSKKNLMIMIQLMFRTTIPQTYNVTQTFRELIEFKPSNIYKKSVFYEKKEFTVIQESGVKYTVLKAALLNDIFNNPIYNEMFQLYYDLTVFNEKQKIKIKGKLDADMADFDKVGVPKIEKINELFKNVISTTQVHTSGPYVRDPIKNKNTTMNIIEAIENEITKIDALMVSTQNRSEREANIKEKNKLEHLRLICSLLTKINKQQIYELLTIPEFTIKEFKKNNPTTNIVDFADNFLMVDYLFVDGIISQEVLSYFKDIDFLREIYKLFNEVKQIYVKIYRKIQQTKAIENVDITNVSQTGNDLYSKFARKFKSICYPERQTTNKKLQEILDDFTKIKSAPTTTNTVKERLNTRAKVKEAEKKAAEKTKVADAKAAEAKTAIEIADKAREIADQAREIADKAKKIADKAREKLKSEAEKEEVKKEEGEERNTRNTRNNAEKTATEKTNEAETAKAAAETAKAEAEEAKAEVARAKAADEKAAEKEAEEAKEAETEAAKEAKKLTKTDLKTLFDVLNRCYSELNPKCRILKDNRLKSSFKDYFSTGVTEVYDKKEDITTYEIYVHLDVAQGVITPQNMNTIQCVYNDNSLLHRFEQLTQKRKYKYWKLIPGPFVVLPNVAVDKTPGKKDTFANIRDYFGSFTRKQDIKSSKGGKRRRRTKKKKH